MISFNILGLLLSPFLVLLSTFSRRASLWTGTGLTLAERDFGSEMLDVL